MQERAFRKWLRDVKGQKETVVASRLSNCRRVEQHKGDLDTHWDRDRLVALLDQFDYSKKDQRNGTPPRHGILIEGDPYTGTATLKHAIDLYRAFRDTNGADRGSSDPDRERWDQYLEDVRRYVESGDLDGDVDFKLRVERRLREARHAVLAGDENCLNLVARATGNKLSFGYAHQKLRNWFEEQPAEAAEALRALWVEDTGLSTADRIREFTPLIPETLPSGKDAPSTSKGSRLRWIALLLMAFNARQHPPYKATEFAETYKRTGHPPPDPDGDEASHYEYAVAFLDKLIERARGADMERPADRLEAQSALSAVAVDRGNDPVPADDRPCWFVGASWDSGDQTDRFVREGIWENGYDDRYLDRVKSIEPGDRIAIKSTYVTKRRLPFDNRGESISTMAIKAIGLVAENLGDGRNLRVDWTPVEPPREWYFYTYRSTLWKVTRDSGTLPWAANALIDFTFQGAKQDHDLFLRYWYPAWYDDPDEDERDEPSEEASLRPLANTDFSNLARNLLYDEADLRKIATLLDDKRQAIFQGPPGTGKTYAARKLAEHLAESGDHVTLVQFHPSYAYEDFVQGYRPTLKEGQAGFALRDGPLLRAAMNARKEPEDPHFLIIDEINRGNLAKVFGELYFLLEYRNEGMQLQYAPAGEERFSLPKNLYIIGTMNTADRSIALVDLALRRRFHFVEFHPDKPPIEGLLRNWLARNAPEMDWIANVVDEANRRLGDQTAAIGPSYFMREGLDEAKVRLIWNHNVLPYIEECLYGEPDRLRDFELDVPGRRLKRRADNREADADDDATERDSVEDDEGDADA